MEVVVSNIGAVVGITTTILTTTIVEVTRTVLSTIGLITTTIKVTIVIF